MNCHEHNRFEQTNILEKKVISILVLVPRREFYERNPKKEVR